MWGLEDDVEAEAGLGTHNTLRKAAAAWCCSESETLAVIVNQRLANSSALNYVVEQWG